jgi:stage V sporulation protein SpoVS
VSILHAYAGHLAEAEAWLDRALLLAEQSRSTYALAAVPMVRAYLSWRRGAHAEAIAAARRCLPLLRSFSNTRQMLRVAGYVAAALAGMGRAEAAATLAGAIAAQCKALHFGTTSLMWDALHAASSTAEAALSPARYRAYVEQGRRLSLEQTIALALDEPAHAPGSVALR